jgi:hypothetical protein
MSEETKTPAQATPEAGAETGKAEATILGGAGDDKKEKPDSGSDAEKPKPEAEPADKKEEKKDADNDKKEEQKKAEDKKDAKNDADGKKEVPKSYDEFFPKDSQLPRKVQEQMKATFKEKGLTAEEAKAGIEHASAVYAAFVDDSKTTMTELSQTWVEEAKADTELGGDGFTKNIELAKRAIDRFGPELKQQLDETGLGNHPDFIRFAYRIGKAMADDSFVSTKGSEPPPLKSTAEVFYGSTK